MSAFSTPLTSQKSHNFSLCSSFKVCDICWAVPFSVCNGSGCGGQINGVAEIILYCTGVMTRKK
jgi:hypothetical protein